MLLIKQVQIVDGSGNKPFVGDILISGQKISAIGKKLTKRKVSEVIDGLGLTVTPGFIDVNNDSDHHLSLFTNPSQKDFLNQGITTIIGGQCGASLAPLMYGSLASLNQWATTDRVNVDWGSVRELKSVLNKIGLRINFETLAGYSTIRRDFTGEEIRDLTKSEIEVFINILNGALKDGALGLSTSLGFLDSKFIPFAEIKKMVSLIAKKGKVYATHLRNEKEDLPRSMEEALTMSRETGAKTIISHLRPLNGYEKEFDEAMNLVEKNLVNSNIYFDINPFTATIFPIHIYLPHWSQNEKSETMLENIKNPQKRKIIAKEMSGLNLEHLVVVSAKDQISLIGKSLLELSQNREKDIVSIILDIMEASKMRAMLMSKSINPALLLPLLSHSRSLIGTNSASLPPIKSGRKIEMERTTSTFTKYLEIVSAQGIQIESAIKKITSIPAQLFGLKNRGLIKEGYFADLVLLKNNKVKNTILNGKKCLE
jgi:N-acyl-D-amino-acid deacylase